MTSVLVIAPCNANGLPGQGSLLAERLREEGFAVSILTAGRSGLTRFLDVAFRGLPMAARHDVVLVNVFGYRAFAYESLAILYGRLFRKRVVTVLRGGWMNEFLDRWPRFGPAVLAMSDFTVAPHEFLKRTVSAKGLRIDALIPNFIEVEKYRFRLRERLRPRLLYMRGFDSLYDAPAVVRAFAIVQRSHPQARLTMAGRPGPDLAPCRSLVARLALRNVAFAGYVEKDGIPALAADHDLYLQANRIENMPISVLEMWAAGVPVVATDAGGTPDLVRDRRDGLLVPAGDYEALGRACLELLANPPLARTLSTNGRERAAELTWEQVGPAWKHALGIELFARGEA